MLREVRDSGMPCLSEAAQICNSISWDAHEYIEDERVGPEWLHPLEETESDAEYCRVVIDKAYLEADGFMDAWWDIYKLVGGLESVKESIGRGEFESKSRLRIKSKSKSRVGVKEAEGRKISGVRICKDFLETLGAVKEDVDCAYRHIVERGGSLLSELSDVTRRELFKGPRGEAKRVLDGIMSNIKKAERHMSNVKANFDELNKTLSRMENSLNTAIRKNR